MDTYNNEECWQCGVLTEFKSIIDNYNYCDDCYYFMLFESKKQW